MLNPAGEKRKCGGEKRKAFSSPPEGTKKNGGKKKKRKGEGWADFTLSSGAS